MSAETGPITVSAPIPISGLERIQSQIAQLKEQLQTSAPGYESLLHLIHKNLIQDEAISHLLTDEEVGVIVAGLAKKKNIVIAEVEKSSARSKTASGKSLKEAKIGIDL